MVWRRRPNAAMHKTVARAFKSLIVGLTACAWVNFAAVAQPAPCKDCSADTGLTVREQIKADRAREADRIAKESADRPWDGKDFGQVRRANPIPVAR
jgi:hypothetical protein